MPILLFHHVMILLSSLALDVFANTFDTIQAGSITRVSVVIVSEDLTFRVVYIDQIREILQVKLE